jgi:aconitate decarboxylase
MGPTAALCKFATGLKRRDVPDEVMERSLYITLDGIGCGLFASHLEWSRRAVEALTEDEGPGAGVIWGWGQGTSATLSALLNGTFIQGSELDDYHPYPLHSCACVLPSVFGAAAIAPKMSGEDAAVAIVVGLETGPRIAQSMGGIDLLHLGWHCGPVYGTIASGAAASRALSLSEEQSEDAIGIAATQASGLMSAQFEAMVKRMHSGFAARNGLTGAILARRGFTGIRAVLERDYGGFASTFTNGKFDLAPLTDGLGENWSLMEIAIKPPYSCMGLLHTPIEAIVDMQANDRLKADDVEHVRIGYPTVALGHAGWKLERPATGIGAQMNASYAVAVTLIDGEPSVPQFGPGRINADDVWTLMERIETYEDDKLNELGYPYRFASRLEVTTRSGSKLERVIQYPKGHPPRDHSNDEIVAKFRRIMGYVIDEPRQQEIIDAVLNLPTTPDTSRLLAAIGPAVRDPFA